MSVTEIVSLACLFILFLITFFVVKNLMHLWRQRAERDGAMMDVQDRENPTLDTPLQPRMGEMTPMGMHLIPRQKGVQESGGDYIDTAIGIQRMLWSQVHFFPSKNCKAPTSSRKR